MCVIYNAGSGLKNQPIFTLIINLIMICIIIVKITTKKAILLYEEI